MGNNINSKLFDAVKRGDVSQVKSLLSQVPSSEILEFRDEVRIFLHDIYDAHLYLICLSLRIVKLIRLAYRVNFASTC